MERCWSLSVDSTVKTFLILSKFIRPTEDAIFIWHLFLNQSTNFLPFFSEEICLPAVVTWADNVGGMRCLYI